MANYVFSKYWVEGTKEGIHELYDAIVNADGEAPNAIEAMGLDVEEYEEECENFGRTEWHNPSVEDKDGYSVLYFEEASAWERSSIIDYLIGDLEDKFTNLYYYTNEEGEGWTNDSEGKYWANRIAVTPYTSDDYEEYFGKNAEEIVQQLHEKYPELSEFDDLEAISEFIDDGNVEDCDSLEIIEIDVID